MQRVDVGGEGDAAEMGEVRQGRQLIRVVFPSWLPPWVHGVNPSGKNPETTLEQAPESSHPTGKSAGRLVSV